MFNGGVNGYLSLRLFNSTQTGLHWHKLNSGFSGTFDKIDHLRFTMAFPPFSLWSGVGSVLSLPIPIYIIRQRVPPANPLLLAQT